MKGKRLVDVLDEDWVDTHGPTYDKFVLLYKRMESKNPNIDDFNLRWVEKKIEDMEGGIVLEREDLEKANTIWKKYK